MVDIDILESLLKSKHGCFAAFEEDLLDLVKG